MSAIREVVLIAKSSSNRGSEAYAEITRALPALGISIVEAHRVETRKELRRRVKRAARSGHKYIVVAGGDGSQCAAAQALAYTKSVLCVIPAGTGNSFAQSLGMQPTIEEAIRTIANGRKKRIDLGVVNGTYFANFAAIGLSAEIGLETPKLLKRIAGGVAYGLSAVVPLLKNRPFSAKISWEKNAIKIETFQMLVASGRYFGNTPILPGASLESGRLAFFTSVGPTRVDVVRMYLAFLAGDQTSLPDAHYFQTKKLKIETKGRQLIALDGSKYGYTPATFSIARKALRVMVPEGALAEREG